MSSYYRVISFHKKPLNISETQFLEQMSQIEAELHWSALATQYGCLAWQAFTPIASCYDSAPPTADWINEYDFQHQDQAEAWGHFLATNHSPFSQCLWFCNVGQLHVLKQELNPQQPTALVKVIRFAKKNPSLQTSQFSKYWLETHSPIASASPFLARYEQLHLNQESQSNGWEGFTFSCFASIRNLTRHAQHPAGLAAAADTRNFLHPDPQPSVITQRQKQILFN